MTGTPSTIAVIPTYIVVRLNIRIARDGHVRRNMGGEHRDLHRLAEGVAGGQAIDRDPAGLRREHVAVARATAQEPVDREGVAGHRAEVDRGDHREPGAGPD